MVLKQLGKASVSSIQAGLEGFLELEPNSNTRFLSERMVPRYDTLIIDYQPYRKSKFDPKFILEFTNLKSEK